MKITKDVCYRTSNGKAYDTLADAVAANITELLDSDQSASVGQISTRVLGRRLAEDGALRRCLLDALGQLSV